MSDRGLNSARRPKRRRSADAKVDQIHQHEQHLLLESGSFAPLLRRYACAKLLAHAIDYERVMDGAEVEQV